MKISRNEINQKYNISKSTWERRHDDLLEWLNDFFPIVEIKENNRYYYEVPDELPDEIPKLPRKTNKQEKVKDYDNYVEDHLPIEFAPMSKAKMSRDAIADFGYEKYGHKSQEAVCKVYVGPAMERLGEKGKLIKWVNYYTYEELTPEQEEYRHQCFSNNNITEEIVAEFGWEIIQSGIIDNKKVESMRERYQNAIKQFKLKYDFTPVRTNDWRKKRENSDFIFE